MPFSVGRGANLAKMTRWTATDRCCIRVVQKEEKDRPTISNLLTNAEASDGVEIALLIDLFQVVQQASTTANHRQQASTGRIILRIAPHVLGQVVNPDRQNRDLNFGRAGIGFTALKFLD